MKYMKLLALCFLCVLLTACQKDCTHEYQAQTTTAATCSQEGVKTFVCTLCNHSYTEAIPMTAHTYVPGTVKTEATCSAEGLQELICSECGATDIRALAMLPHTLGKASVTKEPTCATNGEKTAVCTVCSAVELVEVVPKTENHEFTNEVIQKPTCVDPGKGLDTCSVCGFSRECEYSLADHSYTPDAILSQPTCTTAGSQRLICSVCDHQSSEPIAATGHTWGNAPCGSRRSCTVCSQLHSEPVAHTYKVIEEKAPSERFAGKRVQKCSNCGAEKTLLLATNHSYDMDAIKAELVTYARSLGFQISDVYINTDQTPERYALDIYSMDLPGRGPNQMIRAGKACIDRMYEEYASSLAGIGAYTLFINVYYTQSGSIGTGYLGVAVYIYS